MRFAVRGVLLFCLAVLLAGCAEPPTRELNQAQGAIDAARAAGAAEYAADEFGAAEAALARARTAVDERDYRQALSSSLDARERAQTAAAAASEAKARARTASDRALQAAQAALDHARQRAEAAATAKVPPRSLAGPLERISQASAELDAARAAFDKGDYLAAASALAELPAGLTQVASEIDALVAATPTRRPTRRTR
jgi:hypothetical protein